MATTDRLALGSLAWVGFVVPGASWACFDCREAVEAQVYGADFVPNLFALSLPLGILTAVGSAAYFMDDILDRFRSKEKQHEQ